MADNPLAPVPTAAPAVNVAPRFTPSQAFSAAVLGGGGGGWPGAIGRGVGAFVLSVVVMVGVTAALAVAIGVPE